MTEKGSWLSSGLTDTGQRRDHNEDAIALCPDLGLWAVADGMGGHDRGEVASAMVCDALETLRGESLADLVDSMDDAVTKVNSQLISMAAQQSGAQIIGCTVVALLARGKAAAIMWAGDSRAYLFRGGELRQLSEDHSLEAEMSPEEARSQSIEHVITRAVGAAEELVLDVDCLRLREGDRFLLCSDGLSNEIDDFALASLLANGSAEKVSKDLVDMANKQGGNDNISVIVADYSG